MSYASQQDTYGQLPTEAARPEVKEARRLEQKPLVHVVLNTQLVTAMINAPDLRKRFRVIDGGRK